MITNPLLEEIWAIKDQLSEEADGDLHVFCQQLRAWIEDHPHNGPVVRDAEELRQYFEGQTGKATPG